MDYTRQGPFTPDGAPGLSAARLNAIEDGIIEGITKAEIPIVTVLPNTGLYTGREVYYRFADMDGNFRLWHLVYDAALTSAYKWHVVSAIPMFASVAASDTENLVAGWADLNSVGPSINVPLLGDYEVDWAGRGISPNGSANMLIGLNVAGANPTTADRVADGVTGNQTISPSRFTRVTNLAAGAALKLVYQTSLAGVQFSGRVLRVKPVRVG